MNFLLIKSQQLSRLIPSVGGLTNGNVFVAWEGYQAGTSDIYGRVFFPNGTALGSEFSINQITHAVSIRLQSVAGLTNGNVFVAWEGDQAGNYDIYGRVFFLMEQPLGVSFSLIKSQPMISTIRQLRV